MYTMYAPGKISSASNGMTETQITRNNPTVLRSLAADLSPHVLLHYTSANPSFHLVTTFYVSFIYQARIQDLELEVAKFGESVGFLQVHTA